MANLFKSKVSADIGTSPVTLHTSIAPTTVIGLTVANLLAVTVAVSVRLVKSGGATGAYLIKGATLPNGSSLVIVGGEQKVVLETGDYITVVSDTAASVDAHASILEIS
jgi:hypothetical protein